jgi:hypothetical protein
MPLATFGLPEVRPHVFLALAITRGEGLKAPISNDLGLFIYERTLFMTTITIDNKEYEPFIGSVTC